MQKLFFFILIALTIVSCETVASSQSSQMRGIWKATQLSYPEMAWYAQIQGDVRLKVEVDGTGRIVSVGKDSGPVPLAAIAAEEIKEWQFTSGSQSWQATITLHYSLRKPLSYHRCTRVNIRTPFEIDVTANYPSPEGHPEVMKPKH